MLCCLHDSAVSCWQACLIHAASSMCGCRLLAIIVFCMRGGPETRHALVVTHTEYSLQSSTSCKADAMHENAKRQYQSITACVNHLFCNSAAINLQQERKQIAGEGFQHIGMLLQVACMQAAFLASIISFLLLKCLAVCIA